MLTNPKLERDWGWGMFPILFRSDQSSSWRGDWGWRMFPIPFPILTKSSSWRGTVVGDVPCSIPHSDQSLNWRGDWGLGDVPYSDKSLNWRGDWRLGDVPRSFWPILKLRREISGILSQGLVRTGNRTGIIPQALGDRMIVLTRLDFCRLLKPKIIPQNL